MGVEQGLLALVGAADFGGAYEIEQSIKFDDNRSAYLYRTPASAGNRQTWTYSGWFKRGRTGFRQQLLNSTSGAYIEFVADNTIRLEEYTGSVQWTLKTNAIYRDNSAWYHIVVAFDSTVSSPSSDRIKLWINGERVTSFSGSTYPALNHNSQMNTASEHRIGRYYTSSSDYLDGYLAEVNFIDGSALDHEDFGEFDNNGVWRPIKYAGSYTGNSYYLEFVQGALGTDSSGLGNNWTTSELWEEIGTPNYRGNWIGSTSGSFYSGSWENVFNGDVTVGSNYIYAYNNTATLTFSTPLTGVIEVFGSDGGVGDTNSGFIRLSDNSTWSINSVARANAQWHSFGSKSNITTITVSSPGGHGAILGAIRVDGNLLANISAKANYVNMSDTPTTNWCALNPNDSFLQTISNGNLVSSNTNNVTTPGVRATMALPSGKWYWEITCGVFTSASTWMIGVADTHQRISDANYTSLGSYLYYSGNGHKYNGSGSSAYGATYTTGDVIGVAYDADNGKIWFAKNNTWQNSGDPAAGTGEAYSGITGLKSPYVGTGLYQVESFWNFGQRDFEYTPPTDFLPLNTANLPAPDIADGSDYFNTVLYTGNDGTQSVSGIGFQPDLVWIKNRSNTASHWLNDAVRGAGLSLASDTNEEEKSYSAYFTAFGSDGFSLAGGTPGFNDLNNNYASWNWLAGGSVSADNNTNGSITSTVSANPSAGFSIVSYTGNGQSGATVGHGLGVAPKMIIVKDRDAGRDWAVYHTALGATKNLFLNLTNSAATDSGVWTNTEPTSTVFTVGTSAYTNYGNLSTGDDFIAYCFNEVEGYSKFGSYTGNGNADGPFVFCGFKPRWIMLKKSNTSTIYTSWSIYDTARDSYNVSDAPLYANVADREGTNSQGTVESGHNVDILSNGFKLRDSNQIRNTSGDTYIFAAFAENPFGGSGVSPATAR